MAVSQASLSIDGGILGDSLSQSCLIIYSKGMGIERLFVQYIKLFLDQAVLVLVVNATANDEDFFFHLLHTTCENGLNGARPKVVSAQTPPSERVLTRRLEAFVLQLIKSRNQKLFVKAFSDKSSAFCGRMLHLRRFMQLLFVDHLFMLPRFQTEALNQIVPTLNVVELAVRLPSTVRLMNTLILDLIDDCVRKLKQLCAEVLSEKLKWSSDSAFEKWFDVEVLSTLSAGIIKNSGNAYELFENVKVLRDLSSQLEHCHPTSFFKCLESIKKAAATGNIQSTWLLSSSASRLFQLAQERSLLAASGSVDECELQPKLAALRSVLQEITTALFNETQTVEFKRRVLLVAQDGDFCSMLNDKITLWMPAILAVSSLENPDERNTSPDIHVCLPSRHKTLSDNFRSVDEICAQLPNANPRRCFLITSLEDSYFLSRILAAYGPSVVVLYNSSIQFIRRLEVTKLEHPFALRRIYVLMYSDSMEEKGYLTSIKRENEAFAQLIHENNLMSAAVKSVSGESKTDNVDSVVVRQYQGKVIVDLREFRSELPSQIHQCGFQIVPRTLEIGDYVLTPDICVERKSIDDLVGSLNSGRLYSQIMGLRNFKKPALLVEFDSAKPAAFAHEAANAYLSKDSAAKLVLLTAIFPDLRLLWSDVSTTADIFGALKADLPEPAASTKCDSDVSRDSEATGRLSEINCLEQNRKLLNPALESALLHLPGVSFNSVASIVRMADSLQSLCNNFSTAKLSGENIVERGDCQALFSFLHSPRLEKTSANVVAADSNPAVKRFRK